jgi:glycosyltransferase involved in cell wall biosynthesis
MLRDRESGVIVAAGAPRDMAAAVLDLVARPAHAVHLAEAARRDVERFSWNCTRTQWVALYSGHQLIDGTQQYVGGHS